MAGKIWPPADLSYIHPRPGSALGPGRRIRPRWFIPRYSVLGLKGKLDNVLGSSVFFREKQLWSRPFLSCFQTQFIQVIIFFFYLLATTMCGLWSQFPDQRLNPRPSAMKEQRPNHCITREVPDYSFTGVSFSQRETCTTSGPQSLLLRSLPQPKDRRIHWRVLSRAVRWGLFVFGNWAVARDWFKEQQNSGGVRAELHEETSWSFSLLWQLLHLSSLCKERGLVFL